MIQWFTEFKWIITTIHKQKCWYRNWNRNEEEQHSWRSTAYRQKKILELKLRNQAIHWTMKYNNMFHPTGCRLCFSLKGIERLNASIQLVIHSLRIAMQFTADKKKMEVTMLLSGVCDIHHERNWWNVFKYVAEIVERIWYCATFLKFADGDQDIYSLSMGTKDVFPHTARRSPKVDHKSSNWLVDLFRSRYQMLMRERSIKQK